MWYEPTADPWIGDDRRMTARRTSGTAAAATLGLVLGLSGCGASDRETAAGSTPSAGSVAPARASASPSGPAATSAGPGASEPAGSETGAATVPEQLDFTATTVDGASFSGADVAGQDVLFYFWAPWCPVCRRTAPALADFAAGREDVRLVTVGGSSQDVAEMADFVTDVGLAEFTNLADTTGEIWTRFGVTYQYTYVFVDDSGATETVTGPLDESELARHFDALAAS